LLKRSKLAYICAIAFSIFTLIVVVLPLALGRTSVAVSISVMAIPGLILWFLLHRKAALFFAEQDWIQTKSTISNENSSN